MGGWLPKQLGDGRLRPLPHPLTACEALFAGTLSLTKGCVEDAKRCSRKDTPFDKVMHRVSEWVDGCVGGWGAGERVSEWVSENLTHE